MEKREVFNRMVSQGLIPVIRVASAQEAIDVAADSVVILVRAGTYRESIDLLGKRVGLTGFDPNDPSKAAWPVIDGGGSSGPVVSFTHGEDPNCVLQGFVITGGKGTSAGAIRCSGSSPTIVNCLIEGNHGVNYYASGDTYGGGVSVSSRKAP